MPHLIESLIAAILLIAGLAALLAAFQLRHEPGLPPALKLEDVAQAHRLLQAIGEHGRRLPGPAAGALVSGLLVGDAAVSLWFSVPVLLPELAPLPSALLVATVALVLAKVMRVGVNGLAVAIRRAQVRLRHGRLAVSPREADREDARAMRAAYRSAVFVWPLPPRATWQARCWAGTLPWMLYLAMIVAALLSLRIIGAGTLEDLIGCAVLTVLLIATLTYAIREGVALESLTEPIAEMRRICNRFSSPWVFQEHVTSECRAIEMRLQTANGWCANVFRPSDDGDPDLQVDFVKSWTLRMRNAEWQQIASKPGERPSLGWEGA